MHLCTCVSEEGGDAEAARSETPSHSETPSLLTYTLRCVSFAEVVIVCRVVFREPMYLCTSPNSTSNLSVKFFYYLNQNQNPKTKGIQNSEFKWLIILLNTCIRATVMWSSDLLFMEHNPPHVSWPQEFEMVFGPNFGHSGVRESLLTQVRRKPRLITVLITLGGQSGRGVCPMTPLIHWFLANATLVISLMKGVRRQQSTRVHSNSAPCLQSRDSPWNPWVVKVPRVYKCQDDVGESKSREYGWREEQVDIGKCESWPTDRHKSLDDVCRFGVENIIVTRRDVTRRKNPTETTDTSKWTGPGWTTLFCIINCMSLGFTHLFDEHRHIKFLFIKSRKREIKAKLMNESVWWETKI
jgi:hypothetical protein